MTSGAIFNQNRIVGFWSPRRFDRRYRDPNIIAHEDFIDLRNILHVKDYEFQYGHKEQENYYLFIDEKPTDWSGHFTLCAVMISQSEISKIDEFMKEQRKVLNQKISQEHWYIKGDGKHLYKYKVFNIQDETKYLAQRRWKIYGDMLEELRVNHSFHISSVDVNSYIKSFMTKKEKSAAKHLAWSEAMTELLKSLDMFKYQNLQIVIDNIEPKTHETYAKAIEEFYGATEYVKFEVLPKDDFASTKSNLIQYVDINLFAITKFMYPNFHDETGKYNILVDFELFRYKDFIESKTPFELKMMIELFESIKNIFHYIKFHIIRNVEIGMSFEDNDIKIISLCRYCTKNEKLNFGQYLYDSIHWFCSLKNNIEMMRDKGYSDVGKIQTPFFPTTTMIVFQTTFISSQKLQCLI